MDKTRHGRQWFRQHLMAELDIKYAEFIFLLCYFLSGLCDSSAYRAWGCFVSMQTGNTIFLGLGASEPTSSSSSPSSSLSYGWLKSLISIASFILGSYLFSAASRLSGPRKRGTLIGTFVVQTLLIVIAAALLQSGAIKHSINSSNNDNKHQTLLQLIPLCLIALQSAGQMAASRLLAFNEIPTTVLTSLYYDLASDPGLTKPVSENVKRNRRLLAVLGVVSGAVAGGWISRATGGVETVLWITAACKAGIACLWAGWKEVKDGV